MPTYGDHDGPRPTYDEQLREVFEEKLAPQIMDALDSMKVRWNNLNVVRMQYNDENVGAPVTVLIGVEVGSLTREDGAVAAAKCLELLKEYEVTATAEVAMRECVMWGALASLKEIADTERVRVME